MLSGKHYTYQGVVEDDGYTLGGKIGEVHRKVNIKTMPKENFTSNYLERGEKIYFAKEDEEVILVERENGGIDMFTEQAMDGPD